MLLPPRTAAQHKSAEIVGADRSRPSFSLSIPRMRRCYQRQKQREKGSPFSSLLLLDERESAAKEEGDGEKSVSRKRNTR